MALPITSGPAVALVTIPVSAGGSMAPEKLGEIVGVDLADPGFWSSGLDLIERRLEQAEQTAEEAKVP